MQHFWHARRADDGSKRCRYFEEMQDTSVMQNMISLYSAASACEKGGRWQQALSLLEEMQAPMVVPHFAPNGNQACAEQLFLVIPDRKTH